MTEPEVLFPVKCPVCRREALTGFRISVIADALATGEIRLYANCHVASWDASKAELGEIRDYLDTVWGADLQEACQEFFALDNFPENENLAFIHAGSLDVVELSDDGDLIPL
jgi:hypothetical protein